MDVVVVENYLVDVPQFDWRKVDAELMKIERKDGTPVADKQEAYKRIEEYLNTQCLNQALIQVNLVFNKENGVDKAFEWGFTKRTLTEVSKGENPNPSNVETRDVENYEYKLRYKDLLVDDATLRVNVQKYRDYINSRFEKGKFGNYAKKRCIVLYLSGLSVMKITDSTMRVTHGVSSLWPTTNQHCLVFNTGISSLPTIGHEIGHVLGLEHTFLPEMEDKTGKVTKVSQSENIAKTEREKLSRIEQLQKEIKDYYDDNRTSLNDYPHLEKGYRTIVDAFEKDERQIIADMKCTAALNKYHFEKGKTDNIMDYDNNPRIFFHYQWKIMQEEIVKYYGKK